MLEAWLKWHKLMIYLKPEKINGIKQMPSEKTSPPARQKYLQLYELLKNDILAGVYKNEQQIPTEIELAGRHKLSRPTVAKALDMLRKEGLIERTSGIGSFVQLNPRNKTLNLALLIPGLGETEIFESICGYMSQLAHTRKFNLIWSGSMQEDAASRKEHIESLARHYIEQKVDGVFFTPLELTQEKDSVNQYIVRLFDEANIPVVLMDRDIVSFPARSSYDLVGVDNFRLAYIMTCHLLSQNCQSLKFLAKPHSAPTVQLRIAGFRQALIDAGKSCSPADIVIAADYDAQFISQLLEQMTSPGIVCANDTTASRLMHALSDNNYRIPEDVKVTGVDDIKYANYLRVPLTTYKQPCKEIARIAIELMLTRIADTKQPARTVVTDGQLIIRKSTSPYAGGAGL